MPNNRLFLRDFLLIAEEILGIAYDELESAVCVFRAESALAAPFVRVCGELLFPDPAEQAAVCGWLIIRTRPLPVGNKEVGYECMREMLTLGGCRWSRPEEAASEAAEMLKGVEAKTVDLAEFIAWVRSRVTA
jgi:prophage maintenance system killer protein